MYDVDKAIVQQYAQKHNISQKEALEKLRANYELEVTKVDFKDIALKAVQGMRTMSPKLMGLEQREVDYRDRIISLERELKTTKESLSNIENLHYDLLKNYIECTSNVDRVSKDVFNIIKIFNIKTNEWDKRIQDMQDNRSFLSNVWRKIKCLLRIN